MAVGSAPGVFQVRPGVHRMRVTKEGYATWEKSVLLADGQALTIPLEMSAAGIALPAVEAVLPLDEPLPLSSRAAHGADTVVRVGPALVGGTRVDQRGGALQRHLGVMGEDHVDS